MSWHQQEAMEQLEIQVADCDLQQFYINHPSMDDIPYHLGCYHTHQQRHWLEHFAMCVQYSCMDGFACKVHIHRMVQKMPDQLHWSRDHRTIVAYFGWSQT